MVNVFAQFYPLQWGQKIQSKKPTSSSFAYTEFGEAVLDSSGNIYVVGTFSDTLFPNPTSTSIKLIAKNSEDIYLAKYSPSGAFIWAKSFGSGYGLDMQLDRLGNIYVTGYSNAITNADFDPGVGTSLFTSGVSFTFIAKYDNNGNYLNAKFFSGNGVKGYAIAVDSLFNIYFAGTLNAQVDFDPSASNFFLVKNFNEPRNGFYAKYDANMNLLWAKVDIWVRDCEDIAIHNATNRILIASSGESVTFRLLNPNGVSTDSLVSSAEGNGVRFDKQGNIYCSGFFSGTNVNFNWNGTNNLSTTNGNDEQGFLVKYNVNKVFQWAQAYTISFLNNTFDARKYEMNIGEDGNPLLSFFESDGIEPRRGFLKVNTTNGQKIGRESVFKTNTGGSFNNCSILSSAVDASLVFVSNAGFSNNPASTIDINPDTAASSAIVNLVDDGIWSFIAKYGDCNNAPTIPSSISGNASSCSFNPLTFSVPQVNGATSYTWSLPNGWVGSSDSNSIIVIPALGNGIISVSANNLCGSSSPRTLNLTNVSAPTVGINASTTSICTGSSVTLSGTGATSYQWSNGITNGVAFIPLANTTYTVTGTNNGCTNTASISIVVKNASSSQFNQSICAGSSIVFNGATLNQSGTYRDTIQNTQGCDSIVTLNLLINNSINTFLFDTICLGDVYVFNGANYSETGNYTDTLIAVGGCDSLVNLSLYVNALPEAEIQQISDTLFTQSFETYQWLLNGQVLNGENDSILMVTQNGNYAVLVTDEFGCSDTSSDFSITFVNSSNNKKPHFELYPNPTSNILHCYSSVANKTDAWVLDILGKPIQQITIQSGNNTINANDWKAGVYFIVIPSSNMITNYKIIKQ